MIEREKLTKYQPRTLGQAMRLDGMTPASLVMLHALCKKTRTPRAKADEKEGEKVEGQAAALKLKFDPHDVSDIELL